MAMNSMDSDLYQWFNRLSADTTWAHGIAAAYANYGIALFGVVLLIVWWNGRAAGDTRVVSTAVWAGAACLIAIGLAQPLVSAVNRDRPYAKHPASVVLVDKSTDPSFPSDHATVSGAIAGGLWLTRRRIRYIAVGLALVMAFDRVYVGAHYPGDVVAGLAFGGLIGLIGGRYVIPLIHRILDRLQPSAVGRLISAVSIKPR